MSIGTKEEKKKFQAAGVVTVSIAHGVHDTFTAFFSTLLPLLIERLSLTNTLAGLLSVFLQFPSVLQPVVGHVADRRNLKWLFIFAPTITGVTMSLLGIANTTGFVIFLLVLAGTSSASLHAIGPVVGSTFSGDRLGKGMSFWMVGGELGRTLGPIVAVSFISYLTIEKLPWMMLAGILASIFLTARFKNISTKTPDTQEEIHWKSALKNMKGILLPLSAVIMTRSMLIATTNTFLTTFMTAEGANLSLAGWSLSILQFSGVAGALLAGALSDKFGRLRMLVISFIVTPICMFLFVQSNDLLKIPFLILVGFFGLSITPVLMAIVMENYPEQRSFSNGVYMTISFILSAVAVLLVGFLADLVSLRFAFMVSAAVLPVGLIFIKFLPKSKGKHSSD
jgi:FSR family fosmidomycin resistance protein-like MFS transporter